MSIHDRRIASFPTSLVRWLRCLAGGLLAGLTFACQSVHAEGGEATRASDITIRDGFQVERLRSARVGEGSWISMTFDNQGRLILGRDDLGVARLTLSDDPEQITYEIIENSLRHCRGVLYAHDSLYVCATDSNVLVRLRDTDKDGQFEERRVLTTFDYRSRFGHGANQLVLGPDQAIYVVVGNDVSFPTQTARPSPYESPQNDHLLPSPYDADQDNRVGYIAKMDRDGNRFEILAGGFRNEFDLAFDAHGEMFTYDSDMEWDVGLPWYRPTRVNHVILGGEYGWRWGTGKWPTYYADSLPTTLDIGLGSPTGMEFGTHSRFPAAFREALFMADWQNGRLLMTRLAPTGSTFRGEYEVFLEGAPLNICDLTFGPDGALYFITGGRDSQSGLYRVRATSDNMTAAAVVASSPTANEAQAARAARRHLANYLTQPADQAVAEAWPWLSSQDTGLRYTARLVLERQPLRQWRERALNEREPRAAIAALLALTRAGHDEDQAAILVSLERLDIPKLPTDLLLESLRVYALTFIRHGRPLDAMLPALHQQFGSLYPHVDGRINRELCELLVYLESPRALEKTMPLLLTAPSQEEQIHYADLVSRVTHGWSPSTRQMMFDWLARTRSLRGGKLLSTTLEHIQHDFLASMTTDERQMFAASIEQLDRAAKEAPSLPIAARPIVAQWSVDTLLPAVERQLAQASATQGRLRVAEAACLRCHRIGDEGTPVGPELTTVGKRYDVRALLESIVTPSRQIDPKYRDAIYELSTGHTVSGRVIGVTGDTISLETNWITGESQIIPRAAIESSHPSEISPMPTGLLDSFTVEEIADLIAYLRTRKE